MAEAFLHLSYPQFEVFSAGTKPAEFVHPFAIKVMAETGIDISQNKPKPVEMFLHEAK